MTDREYRQDDTSDGYCPQCGDPLSGLTVAGRGYCDRHGWTWAEWNAPGRTALQIWRERTASGNDDDERNDAP